MEPAASSTWSARGVEYARAPLFGPDHVLARLTAGELPEAWRALGSAQAGSAGDASNTPSDSPFMNRARLAERLAAYNGEVGNPLEERRLQDVRADVPFIIGGQQPGLLLSPMYMLLKAVGAAAWARRVQQGRPGAGAAPIPAFWIASEDHDLEEVNRCVVNGRRFTVPHPEMNRPGPRPPVGRLPLSPWRDEILRFLAEALEGEPHREWVMELAAEVRFDDYATLAADLLARLLGPHGLVLVDPMWLRELTGPVLAAMVERWGELEAALREGTNRVRRLGLDAPLDRLNLFRIDEARRSAVRDPAALDPDEVLEHPERYSPGAALRPIVQDAILPAAVTLAGPTELVYLWQIDPLYDVMGVRRSRPHPRLSVTILDDATARRAERIGLGGEKVLDVRSALERYEPPEWIEDAEDVRRIEALGAELLDRIGRLTGNHQPGPPIPNPKLLHKARRSIAYQVGRVAEQARRQRLESARAGRRRLERIAQRVYPLGRPQERTVSALEPLARHGPELIERMIDTLDPLPIQHWLIEAGT